MEFILSDKLVLRQIEDPRVMSDVKIALSRKNPQYVTLQRLGRWTGGVPEKLTFYEIDPEIPDEIVCPRGFADPAYRICWQYNEKIHVIDRTRTLEPIEFTFQGKLRDFQETAVSGPLFKKTHGVLSAGTGSGKTVMGLYLIAVRQQPALVMVHTMELLQQWLERIETFLGISQDAIGVVGGGKFRIGEKITVGLYQSIRKRVADLNLYIGHVVVDECHKCPSKTFTEAVAGFEAKYRLGLTATDYRRDGLGDLIFFTLGELRHTIAKAPLVASGNLVHAQVRCRKTAFETDLDASVNYPAVIKALSKDDARNRLICRDIAQEIETDAGGKLILTDRRAHAVTLQQMLHQNHSITAEVLTGTTPKSERERIVQGLGSGEIPLFIATGQLIGEGFDLPTLSTLFLAMPITFKGRLIQYIGRVLRPSEGKLKGVIYDYMDILVGVLEASAVKRITYYREEGLEVLGFDKDGRMSEA